MPIAEGSHFTRARRRASPARAPRARRLRYGWIEATHSKCSRMRSRDVARIGVGDVERGVLGIRRAALVVARGRRRTAAASRRGACRRAGCACARRRRGRRCPAASCAQPALRKNRRRAYCPGLSRLSMRGLTKMPLPESPVPIRCAWLSQTLRRIEALPGGAHQLVLGEAARQRARGRDSRSPAPARSARRRARRRRAGERRAAS